MKRIVALDLGDAWIGVAHTDLLQITVQPVVTWKAHALIPSLKEYLAKNKVESVVIGMPYTMKGNSSEQTKKIIDTIAQLKEAFPEVIFLEQDERLSSQFSQRCAPVGIKNKNLGHARAAAIILENFLMKKSFNNNNNNNNNN